MATLTTGMAMMDEERAHDNAFRLSSWARVLDALGVGLLLIGLSVIVTGGFREWTPIGRISVRSWPRPVVIGAMALLVRHWFWRRPSITTRALTAFVRWRRSEEARHIWPVFLSTRFGVLIVGFLGIVLLGYAPNTPPYRLYGNNFLNMPARWDTGWFLGIAVDGYSFDPSAVNTMQNIAFFPAYPMLMRFVSVFAARQVLWGAMAISFVAFLWAMVYLFRLARAHLDEEGAAASVAFLAAYPFALFYSAAYTEALFLLTVAAACYHFERDELWRACVWGLAAGLTRPNGCLLSVVLVLIAIRGHRTTPGRVLGGRLVVAAAPGVGFLIYSAYVYYLTGNPLQWAAQHAAWGRVYRGLDALVVDRIQYIQANGLYDYASTLGLDMINALAVIFALGSVWPVFRRFGAPYAAMVLLNVLVPLTLGGVLSMGRLTSTIFPMFLWLGAAIPARHRSSWLIGFAMLQAVFAVTFFTWRPLY
jgi:hypothetical protein